jgi:hydroxypyruvate reductase
MHLDELLTGDALVLGAGKAAALMAAEFAQRAPGRVRGLVVTRYDHGLRPEESAGNIEVIEAQHPLPDGAGVEAGQRLLDLARSIHPNETLYFLVSGGGSALCAAPLPGVSLTLKSDTTDFLMRSGADIREINCVRRHLSAIKGGRLAVAAHPAKVVTLAISDVPGNSLGDIASGPTVPDPTTQGDAIRILERFACPQLEDLRSVLTDPANESPKPADAAFDNDNARAIATSKTAMDAAARFLSTQGCEVIRLGDDLTGDARSLGREHARLAIQHATEGKKAALLSGGETTVVLRENAGRGGRNLEYLASLAQELHGFKKVYALAADTDGIDGSSDAAGACFGPDLLTQAEANSVDLAQCLEKNDTHHFFEACGLLVKTGPTRTNVNDFRLLLVGGK